MGKSSRRKQLPPEERAKRKAESTHASRWTRLAWVGGTVVALVLVGLFVFTSARTPSAAQQTGHHGEPIAGTASFLTTDGGASLADYRGSKLVIYFYEGVG